MGFVVNLYDAPFYGGAGTVNQVPNVYPVALNGRPFMVDFNQPFYRQYKREVTQLLRNQADVGATPGEQSINPEDLWRRSADDWIDGAGQIYLDRKESTEGRFRDSLGINVWNKWQITLLNDTVLQVPSSNANLHILYVGSYCYESDGSVLRYTANAFVASPVYVTVTGMPGTQISSIATDGYNVYAATPSGLYWTNTSTSAATALVTSTLDAAAVVDWQNGRLMLANLNSIYNITSTTPAGLPAPLFTHFVPTARWVAFAGGDTRIYAALTVGNKSWIYGTGILTDGTALAAPMVQGQTPNGETITAMVGYLGFLAVGTTAGVRFCTTDAAGTVTMESLIPTPNPVSCLNGFDRFIWFGWTNFDATHTGLGRMDLQNFAVAQTQPAYASDLMAVGFQGNVVDAKTVDGLTIFAVAGVGFFYEDTTHLAPQGYIDSGYILYDLSDLKVGVMLDVQSPVPLPGGYYAAYISSDGAAWRAAGVHHPADPDPVNFSLSQVQAQRFEIRFQLYRDAVNPAIGPLISRFTLRAWPTPRRPLVWQMPLLINEDILTTASDTEGFSPLAQVQFLEGLCIAGEVVNFQEGLFSYPVIVADVTFLPDAQTLRASFFNGVALVQLKGIPNTT